MAPRLPRFRSFWWRACSTHVITYFVFGLLALTLLDYGRLYSETELRHVMRATTSPWVAAGAGLQLVRGTVFALVLWPLAGALLEKSWWVLWGLLVGLVVLGAAGPAPGSLEGAIFTTLPPSLHLVGLPEVLLQTAAFSFLLHHWCLRPARWKTIVSIAGVALILLMSLLGVLEVSNAS